MQRAITSPGRAVCLVDFLFSGCTKMLFSADSRPFFFFFSKRQPLLPAVTQTLWLRIDKKTVLTERKDFREINRTYSDYIYSDYFSRQYFEGR